MKTTLVTNNPEVGNRDLSQESKHESMRLIVDKKGDGHQDLFFKIDAMPTLLMVADSYFLSDFLKLEEDIDGIPTNEESFTTLKAIKFIEYLSQRINNIELGQKTFIPLSLNDECLGGLFFEKSKRGFLVSEAWTTAIHGHDVTESNFDSKISEHISTFEVKQAMNWILSEESINQGLDWSQKEIQEK